VLQETRARAARLGLSVALLPVLDDVDTEEDLRTAGLFGLDPRKPAG